MPSPLTESAKGIGVMVGVGEEVGVGVGVAGSRLIAPGAEQAVRTRKRLKQVSLRREVGELIVQDYTN
jgi:hypothetical protein